MFKIVIALVLCLFSINSLEAQIRVMSYNIKYANENDGENSWSQRKDFLTNQVRFYHPDILGVQEAVYLQMEHFTEKIPSYDYVGVGREDGMKEGEFSAIFYDRERLIVLEDDTFWLSQTPDSVSIGWDAAFKRVCTYALFESKQSGEKFWVFNTHFDHVGEQARRESVNVILAKIEELNTADFPVILMGDFNLEPSHPSMNPLYKKMDDSKSIAQLTFGPCGTFNAYDFQSPVTRRIDYIFVSKEDAEVLKYAVLSDSKALKYPSDHFPVYIELNFK